MLYDNALQVYGMEKITNQDFKMLFETQNLATMGNTSLAPLSESYKVQKAAPKEKEKIAHKNNNQAVLEAVTREIVDSVVNEKPTDSQEILKQDEVATVTLAIFCNQADVIKDFISEGGDIRAFASALLHVAASNSKDVYEILIKHGFKVNYKTNFSRTPLFFASIMNATAAMDVLIGNGAIIDAWSYRSRCKRSGGSTS